MQLSVLHFLVVIWPKFFFAVVHSSVVHFAWLHQLRPFDCKLCWPNGKSTHKSAFAICLPTLSMHSAIEFDYGHSAWIHSAPLVAHHKATWSNFLHHLIDFLSRKSLASSWLLFPFFPVKRWLFPCCFQLFSHKRVACQGLAVSDWRKAENAKRPTLTHWRLDGKECEFSHSVALCVPFGC